MKSLDDLLTFVEFTHLAHKTERVARIKGTDRRSNIVEHSYQIALVAWYIIEKEKLPLNKEKVFKYALAHDLVEVHAGDTYAFDTEHAKTKADREKKSREHIKHSFPEFKELHPLIEEYESRKDLESRFVYAVDKIIDPLNIFLEGGKLWQEKGVTLNMLLEYKTKRIALDPIVNRYFEALVVRLKKGEKELFGSELFPKQ